MATILSFHNEVIHKSHNLRGLLDHGRRVPGTHVIYSGLPASHGRWPIVILYADGSTGTDTFAGPRTRKYWAAQRAARNGRYINDPSPHVAGLQWVKDALNP